MSIMIVRPERNIPLISSEDSPPCIECANCKLGRNDNGVCKHPDNAVDELVFNVSVASGTCGGFTYRTTTTRATA